MYHQLCRSRMTRMLFDSENKHWPFCKSQSSSNYHFQWNRSSTANYFCHDSQLVIEGCLVASFWQGKDGYLIHEIRKELEWTATLLLTLACGRKRSSSFAKLGPSPWNVIATKLPVRVNMLRIWALIFNSIIAIDKRTMFATCLFTSCLFTY